MFWIMKNLFTLKYFRLYYLVEGIHLLVTCTPGGYVYIWEGQGRAAGMGVFFTFLVPRWVDTNTWIGTLMAQHFTQVGTSMGRFSIQLKNKFILLQFFAI